MSLRSFIKNESGATAIEYSLIAALIAMVIITAVISAGSNLSSMYTMIGSKMN